MGRACRRAPAIGSTAATTLMAASCAIAPAARSAETPTVTPPPVAGSGTPASSSRFIDPADGQFDLSAILEHPHGLLPIPIIVTEPAVGYGGGVVGMFLRPREEEGQTGWSRPDISALGGLATENGTWLALAGDSSRWLEGRLQTLAGAGVGKINLDFYGAAFEQADLEQKFRYSLTFSGAIGQADWRLSKSSRWAIGLRYVYADITPDLHDQPAAAGPGNASAVKVSAPTAILEYDSRDNIFTPRRGLYSETSYLVSRSALGSSADFERFHQILLAWLPLPHEITLGARADYAWSSAGTPFFLRPYILLRGVPAVRYQGDEAASLELEARWQFSARWSVVPFAGVGATHLEHALSSSDGQAVGAGGIGLRYELARKFGLHAGLDVAHSPGTTAVYIQIGNAWFRP